MNRSWRPRLIDIQWWLSKKFLLKMLLWCKFSLRLILVSKQPEFSFSFTGESPRDTSLGEIPASVSTRPRSDSAMLPGNIEYKIIAHWIVLMEPGEDCPWFWWMKKSIGKRRQDETIMREYRMNVKKKSNRSGKKKIRIIENRKEI